MGTIFDSKSLYQLENVSFSIQKSSVLLPLTNLKKENNKAILSARSGKATSIKKNSPVSKSLYQLENVSFSTQKSSVLLPLTNLKKENNKAILSERSGNATLIKKNSPVSKSLY